MVFVTRAADARLRVLWRNLGVVWRSERTCCCCCLCEKASLVKQYIALLTVSFDNILRSTKYHRIMHTIFSSAISWMKVSAFWFNCLMFPVGKMTVTIETRTSTVSSWAKFDYICFLCNHCCIWWFGTDRTRWHYISSFSWPINTPDNGRGNEFSLD